MPLTATQTAPASMTHRTAPPPARSLVPRPAARALAIAAACWCGVAIAGQLMLAAYVLLFYGRAAAAGHPEIWNKVLPHGYVPGNAMGNAIVGLHLLFTAVIMTSGAIQLVPQVRRHAPRLHRWNGRLYIVSALVMGTGGFVMVLTRHTVGDAWQHAAIVINAALIVAFAGIAWRHAIARRFDRHRRWALRLFLVVGGVWFFRIGLTAWLVVNRGPVGFDPETFRGPFLTLLGFGQYIVPLAVLETYFRVQDNAGPRGHMAMTAGLGALTLLTAFGIGTASMIMWLPRM